MGIKLYQNKEWLEEKYWVEKLETPDIAKMCGCGYKLIWKWLVKHKIKRRTRSEVMTGRNITSLKERFLGKVNKNGPNGCWIWTGACNSEGYGNIGVENRTEKAHRVSWELYNGKIPKGLCICHKCDNPKCVNPEHLFLGTNQDNTDDMIQKGREANREGEKNPKSKLTEEIVLWVRSEYDTGKYTMKQLAEKCNVIQSTIGKIINRKSWKHLEVKI